MKVYLLMRVLKNPYMRGFPELVSIHKNREDAAAIAKGKDNNRTYFKFYVVSKTVR